MVDWYYERGSVDEKNDRLIRDALSCSPDELKQDWAIARVAERIHGRWKNSAYDRYSYCPSTIAFGLDGSFEAGETDMKPDGWHGTFRLSLPWYFDASARGTPTRVSGWIYRADESFLHLRFGRHTGNTWHGEYDCMYRRSRVRGKESQPSRPMEASNRKTEALSPGAVPLAGGDIVGTWIGTFEIHRDDGRTSTWGFRVEISQVTPKGVVVATYTQYNSESGEVAMGPDTWGEFAVFRDGVITVREPVDSPSETAVTGIWTTALVTGDRGGSARARLEGTFDPYPHYREYLEKSGVKSMNVNLTRSPD